MAGYLLKNNPLKILTNRTKVLVPVSKLWQYGISGDLPILLSSHQEFRRDRIGRRSIESL